MVDACSIRMYVRAQTLGLNNDKEDDKRVDDTYDRYACDKNKKQNADLKKDLSQKRK